MRLEMGQLYVHKSMKDGTYSRDVIVKKDDHGVDSCRYALASFETLGVTVSSTGRLKGVW